MNESEKLDLTSYASRIRESRSTLDSLSHEHVNTVNKIKNDLSSLGDDKILSEMKLKPAEELLLRLNNGIGETNLYLMFIEMLEKADTEKNLVVYHAKKLVEENRCLLDQLKICKQEYRDSELKVIELEDQVKALNYQLELEKYDMPTGAADSSNNIFQNSNEVNKDGDSASVKDEGDIDLMTTSQTVVSQATSNCEIPARLKTLYNLVIQYANNGRYEVAVPLCKQALGDLEKASGHNHPDVATMLNILALVYRDQGKYKEAANLLNDSLRIRESTLGANHPTVASTLNNLAVLYGKRGKFKEAEPLCKRALAIRETVLGSSHPDVAKQLNNLALLCQNQNKHDEVELYYQRALEIYIANYGPDDPIVTKTKNNLACAYMKQNKYNMAEDLYKEILNQAHVIDNGPISEKNMTIWQFAELRQNDPAAYSACFENKDHEKSIMYSNAYRVSNQQVGTTLRNLGTLYRRKSKFLAAEVVESCAARECKPP